MKTQRSGKPLCRFPYTHQGKTLYYDIISDSTVEVTYYSSVVTNNYVNGDVLIPSSVEYNGTTYSVTSIGLGAFRGCSGLASVSIPNSVTTIGRNAFSYCSGLTSVTIPNSVTYIEAWAFYDCSGLTSIDVASENTHYSSIDGVLYNYAQDTLIKCPDAKTSVTIPNSVTSIEDEAFSYCSGLTSVTIPNSVTSIGSYAFEYCSGLTSVTIPNSVTYIGSYVFYDCSGLTSIDVASENTHYSSIDGVLYNYAQDTLIKCPDAKTSVTIPNSVIFIESYAFFYCSGLTSVTIPNSVISIGNYAFSGCSGLTSVSIPNSVTTIGRNAFSDCSSLNSINVASGNTRYSSIDGVLYNYVQDTLMQCPGAKTSVSIPNSVTFIGAWAFYACSGLTSIKCLASIPPSIGNNSFQNISDTCLLTVPCGSLEAYTTSDWNTYFATRISEDLSFELSVSANDEAYGRVEVETQSCNVKTLTATANEGYEFTAWNDGNTENPRTVTVTSDTAFVAIFTEAVSTPTITVTVNDATMGSASYTLDGNTAVLTATANEGYEFTGWNDGNTENPRTVSLTSDTAFVAIFTEAVSTPTITVTVNDATMGSASYTLDGNTAVLTATANEGYEFTGWNDGNTENPRTVSLTSDTAFVAIFTEAVSTPTITVTVNDATMGSASYTLDGNTAVLTATANEGYRFLTWNDGNTENPRTVTSDTVFTAIFTASGSSSLQEVNAREFAIYPNPAKSFVTLEFEALQENILLQILDINGRRVRTLDLKAGREVLKIDLGDLPKGVYTIMLGNVTKKLIVE